MKGAEKGSRVPPFAEGSNRSLRGQGTWIGRRMPFFFDNLLRSLHRSAPLNGCIREMHAHAVAELGWMGMFDVREDLNA